MAKRPFGCGEEREKRVNKVKVGVHWKRRMRMRNWGTKN